MTNHQGDNVNREAARKGAASRDAAELERMNRENREAAVRNSNRGGRA